MSVRRRRRRQRGLTIGVLWDVTFEGMRVRFEIYETTNDSGDRLLINYFP